MIDDLQPFLERSKRQDLVQRLNNKDPEQSLGAEAELSIAWSLREFDLEIEPIWWKPPKCPDIYVEGLVLSNPLAIEVTSFADVAVSGEDVMDHCVQELVNVANAERKGAGNYLYFNFAETSIYRRGRNERGIAAPRDYKPSEATKLLISNWIITDRKSERHLRIEDAGLVVEIEYRAYKQIRYHNYHVSRPPRVYSDTSSPLYRRLAEKAVQLKDTPDSVWRVIVVIEAGSRFLAELSSKKVYLGVERYLTAQQVIQKFVQDKCDKIDAVIVLVPTKRPVNNFNLRSEPSSKWHVSIFGSKGIISNNLQNAFKRVIETIPAPRFDGFNARSLIRQKALKYDARGWYLAQGWTMKDDNYTYRMSSRAFQDFLAHRIDEEQFRRFVGAEKIGPSIGRFLDQGYTIQSIQFESGGIDKDDDYIVLELSRDPAACAFE
jgi:hypothetical protein